MKPILVTGATGNAGREVVAALAQRNAPVRVGLTAHRADWQERARRAFGPQIETSHLDFFEPATFDAAARGCSAVFLLRPPPISDVEPTLNAFVDRALAQGVEHVVFLSVQGADENSIVPHHEVERHLVAHAESYTILRPGFFAQNLVDAYRRDIREDHRLYVPAGRGKAAFVDLRDVAEVAAQALVHPELHQGQGYLLTGPTAHSFEETAQLLSRALPYEVRYLPASIPGYLWHLTRRRGLRWPHALVQTILHVGLRFGQAERTDPTLERLLGRPATPFAQFIHDHAHVFLR